MLEPISFAMGALFAVAVLLLLRDIARQIRHARTSLEYELREARRAVERSSAQLLKPAQSTEPRDRPDRNAEPDQLASG
jgi:hypothetical protein